SLFSKNGLAARKIAKKLIHVEDGGRIPRVEDFAQTLSIGLSTIQEGFRVLSNMHALKVESRGYLGTYLVYKNIHLLKEIAGEGALVGAMPLPYSRRYEGLATGLIEVSESMSEQVNMAYMRGSRQRLEGLKSRRHDFAVMSRLAAEEEMKQDRELEIAADFGAETFVTSHRIFLADPSKHYIQDGMRVGVDYSSIDQSFITALECKHLDVEFVPINYMQMFENLQQGNLDAAVWNPEETRIAETFNTVDFRNPETNAIAVKASIAAILIEKNRTDVHHLFKQIDRHKVVSIQKLVVDKEKLPQY